MRKLRHVPLFITLLCLLVMDYYIGRVLDGQTNTAAGMILGVVFAQVVLFAVWTALGPGSLFTRSIMGFCGTMLIALALVACIHRAGGGHVLEYPPRAYVFRPGARVKLGFSVVLATNPPTP